MDILSGSTMWERQKQSEVLLPCLKKGGGVRVSFFFFNLTSFRANNKGIRGSIWTVKKCIVRPAGTKVMWGWARQSEENGWIQLFTCPRSPRKCYQVQNKVSKPSKHCYHFRYDIILQWTRDILTIWIPEFESGTFCMQSHFFSTESQSFPTLDC